MDGSLKQLVLVLIYMQPGSWLYLSPDLMETKQSPEIVVLAFSEYIRYKVLSRTTAVPQQKHTQRQYGERKLIITWNNGHYSVVQSNLPS